MYGEARNKSCLCIFIGYSLNISSAELWPNSVEIGVTIVVWRSELQATLLQISMFGSLICKLNSDQIEFCGRCLAFLRAICDRCPLCDLHLDRRFYVSVNWLWCLFLILYSHRKFHKTFRVISDYIKKLIWLCIFVLLVMFLYLNTSLKVENIYFNYFINNTLVFMSCYIFLNLVSLARYPLLLRPAVGHFLKEDNTQYLVWHPPATRRVFQKIILLKIN